MTDDGRRRRHTCGSEAANRGPRRNPPRRDAGGRHPPVERCLSPTVSRHRPPAARAAGAGNRRAAELCQPDPERGGHVPPHPGSRPQERWVRAAAHDSGLVCRELRVRRPVLAPTQAVVEPDGGTQLTGGAADIVSGGGLARQPSVAGTRAEEKATRRAAEVLTGCSDRGHPLRLHGQLCGAACSTRTVRTPSGRARSGVAGKCGSRCGLPPVGSASGGPVRRRARDGRRLSDCAGRGSPDGRRPHGGGGAATIVPTPVWGRDECRAGEMWNSNSLTAWLIARCGLPTESIRPPPGGRAPGWRAGLVVARRQEALLG